MVFQGVLMQTRWNSDPLGYFFILIGIIFGVLSGISGVQSWRFHQYVEDVKPKGIDAVEYVVTTPELRSFGTVWAVLIIACPTMTLVFMRAAWLSLTTEAKFTSH